MTYKKVHKASCFILLPIIAYIVMCYVPLLRMSFCVNVFAKVRLDDVMISAFEYNFLENKVDCESVLRQTSALN